MNNDGKTKRKPRRYVDDATILRAANDPAHKWLKDAARAIGVVRRTMSRRLEKMGAKWDKEKNLYVLPPGRTLPTTEYLKHEAALSDNPVVYQLMPHTTSLSTAALLR